MGKNSQVRRNRRAALSPGRPVHKDTRRPISSASAMSVRLRQGPLPSPEYIEAYGRLIPNGAERLMALAEKQAAHRMQEEAREGRLASRGQVLAFVVVFGLLGLSTAYVLKGYPWQGLAPLIGGFITVAGLFLRRRRRSTLDPDEAYHQLDSDGVAVSRDQAKDQPQQ